MIKYVSYGYWIPGYAEGDTLTNASLNKSIDGDFNLISNGSLPISGVLHVNIGEFTLASSSKILLLGSVNNVIGDVNLTSGGILTLNSALQSSIGVFQTDLTGILTLNSELQSSIGVFQTDLNGKIFIKADMAEMSFGDFVLSGFLETSPYSYTNEPINTDIYQTSTESTGWPFGFSTFTTSDGPYRS